MRSIVVCRAAKVARPPLAVEKYGRDPARRHINDIRKAVDRLAIDGARYRKEPQANPGLQRLRTGHHFIVVANDDKRSTSFA